ncbi:ribosomal protein L11 methyltransferase [Draconibacterium orientale]|uniref:Ribosomal protein L11 methyltransferase n=1 Tax=Draconibacterium orientale TaxID=1168034 RepID=X5E1B3_9BACT|nr:50S ribosomal protein L11 methyltransferase [Draconibacterium orientale]AHW61265.1 ribosomal protein L11 methyltransferase [Draconibacterium orientale]SET99801.1 ribosomal protein L11 methyltransferase [Draconibacterium orientale]
MDYQKISIQISPFQEWLRDVLNAQLAEIGFDSFVETETGFDAFIPATLYAEESMNEVLEGFSGDFSFDVKSELIADQNWNEEWEKNYFKPLVIGGECMIRAPFHTEYPHAKYEIVIEPNMAFGTGNHETTATIIESILQNDLSGKTILDMGCGTGILSILASMKGAKQITAIDIDKWSYQGTCENAALNNITNIDAKLGDASLLGNEKFDLIFANIHKNVLLNDMESYHKVLNDGGTLIMSGFYTEDIKDIKSKAESLGMKDAGFVEKNNWVAHSFLKPD